ncbi:MAG: LytTR family transcriptional regulator DNA-binding domain-containing protein [Lachnospiraceae bacterium]|nr:LytTR family transcriptional regulator DNA-binding domain-containing protein [Lachnospiraceae bacterium]
MDRKISVKVEINSSYDEPQVIIRTDKEDEMIADMVRSIEQCLMGEQKRIPVCDDDHTVLLDPADIIHVYIENRKLVICTVSGIYRSRRPLSEFENALDDDDFVRISRFEIVNLRRVSSLDMSVSGTIRIIFEDGSETWVARRYVRNIQQKLSSISKGGR